jgi:hypothetical protein
MSCLRSWVTILFKTSRGRTAVALTNFERMVGGDAGKLEVEWQEVGALGGSAEGGIGEEGVLFWDRRASASQTVS